MGLKILNIVLIGLAVLFAAVFAMKGFDSSFGNLFQGMVNGPTFINKTTATIVALVGVADVAKEFVMKSMSQRLMLRIAIFCGLLALNLYTGHAMG